MKSEKRMAGSELKINPLKLIETIAATIEIIPHGNQPQNLPDLLQINGHMLDTVGDSIKELARDISMISYFAKLNGSLKGFDLNKVNVDKAVEIIMQNTDCDCPSHRKSMREDIQRVVHFLRNSH